MTRVITDNNPSNFLLIAHRGGLFYRPENTVAAFENSVAMGIRWVECDVRLADNGVPALSHDERVPVPGEGWLPLRELDAARLANCDVGGGELVPTLRQLFAGLSGELFFDLEIKELDVVEPVVRLVAEFGLEDRVTLSSFIPEALQLALREAPHLTRGLLIDRITGALVDSRSSVNAARLLECQWLLPEYRTVDAEFVKLAHDDGLKVIPWTVNRPTDAARFLDMGVDGIISDRPDQFRALITEKATQWAKNRAVKI